MPLKPNLIERQVINAGLVPGLMIDMGLPLFQFFAMIGAMEIGLFRHLSHEPADVSALAKKTDASERGIEILLQALEPLGYVQQQNGRYALTKLARKMPLDLLETMVPFFKSQAVVTIPEIGRGLREAPAGGVYGWDHVKSGEVGRGYQAAMRWLASGMVDQIVKMIKLPDGAMRMLDVGGSHGLYTVAFCRQYPQLKGTALDWKIGLEEAEKTLAQNPDVAGRIDLVERDFEKEELPEGYDFAFLGNIIHGVSPEGNRDLFGKLARATTERGMVAILDQYAGIKGSKFGRAVAGLAGLNLFLFAGGRAYPFEEVKKWLAAAGFTQTRLQSLRMPGMSLVISQKASQ